MQRISFRAAIFDLDGTILDSMGLWNKIGADFLAKRNLALPPGYAKELYPRDFRQAAAYTIRLFGLQEKPEAIMEEWNRLALYAYGHTIPLKPYAKEYLVLLHSLGIKLGVATSLPKLLYEPVLLKHGLYELFDACCSTEEVGKGKDWPDIFLLAARRLCVHPQDCIVLEDTLQGVRSAKKTGMRVFGVYDRYAEADRLRIEQAADGYLYSLSEAPLPRPQAQ